MRVLVVNGFEEGRASPLVDAAVQALDEADHDVDRIDLAAAGFDAFMSADERAAYLTDQPLITPEAIAAAAQVRSAAGLVVVYPVIHGTAPPRVKSWQERVFVLGVGFEFQPSGVITGALTHMRRALVVGVDPSVAGSKRLRRPPGARRNDFGPCFARMFYLSSNRSCRQRYLVVKDEQSGATSLRTAITRWP